MKSNKYKYIIAIGLALSFSSCEKELELNPEQSLSGTTAFSTGATAQSTLLGVYSTFQTLELFGSVPQIISDYQADNVNFVGSFPTFQDINNYLTVPDNGSINTLWQVNYRGILRANKVIAKVPGVTDVSFSDAKKKQYVAEAKFLRALAYFQMANLFSQPFQVSGGTNLSVPLNLESFEGDITFPKRATLNEVHAQVKKDLLEALPDLPASYSTPEENRGRATKGAANALLSRLALYRDELPDAITYSRAVIASPNYALAADYSFYDGNTSEDVFSIQNSATDNGRTGSGGWSSFYNATARGGRGDCPFSANLIAAYNDEPTDKRFALKRPGIDAGGNSSFFTLKFPDATSSTDNSPVIRITEVYLNLAEALAKSAVAPSAEATTIVNNLRSRAGLPAKVFVTKQALIDQILIERRKELAFEGHRRMDLLRNKLPLRVGFAKGAYGADLTILPIPTRELDINPSLVQNPG